MKAFHFGDPATPLFGCHHPAASAVSRAAGAVLCAPVLHEYMSAHRTLRQLGLRLAQAGIGALRFDYFGTGDSAGELEDAGPSRWRADVDLACGELSRRLPGVTPSLIGLRFGATLALQRQLSADAPEVPSLVLWDPVLDGAMYVEELMAVHQERYRSSTDEVLGFPFGPRLRTELSGLAFEPVGVLRARRALLIETLPGDPRVLALVEASKRGNRVVDHRLFPGAPIWHEPGKMTVQAQVVQAVVSWMKEGQ